MVFYLNNINRTYIPPGERSKPIVGDLIVDYLEVGIIVAVFNSFDSIGRRHWRCIVLNQNSCKRRLVSEVIPC